MREETIMRKNIISALALMLGVFGFSGCVKNADETINSEIQEFTLISHADAPNTRMNISGDKTTGFSTNWEDGDQIGVYAVSENAEHTLYTCNYSHSATVDSDGLAKFTGTIRSTGGDDFSLYAYYPYTAGSTYTDLDDQKGVDCKISSVQTMTGASFDKSCAYMVAKTGLTVNTASQDNSYEVGNWQFRHTVAFINLSTKAISAEGVSGDEIVSSVKFEAVGISENPTLAGDFQFNLEDGAMTFTNSENVVTVNVPAETELSALSAWIVTNPFEMTVDDELEITITTDAHTIFKRVSIAKNFEAANVYTLNLTIDNNCEIEDAEPVKPEFSFYWDLSIDETFTATADEISWSSDIVDMYVAKGSSQTNCNNYYPGTVDKSYISTRFYNGQLFSITPNAGYTISKIVFDATTPGYAQVLPAGTWTNATCEYSGQTVTIIPTNGDNKISTRITGTCGFTKVTIYYSVDPAKIQPTLILTPDDNVVELAADDTTQHTISVKSNTENINVDSDSDWLIVGYSNGIITYQVTGTSEIERTANITVSATNDNGETKKIISVTQKSLKLAAPEFTSVTGTTETITATWNKVEPATSYDWELYKGTDKETGTLVEDVTGEIATNNDVVTLTISGTFAEGEQYALYVKSAAEAPFVESEFAESEAFEIKAAGTEPEPVTVEMSTFTATSDNIDTNISYTTAKGGGTSNPAINGGQIRLYQNSAGTGGGTITITAKEGFILTSVTIGSSMGTSIAYTIGDSTTKSTTESLSANGKKEVTVNDKSITFYCMGTSTSTRLYVNYLSVTYQAQ